MFSILAKQKAFYNSPTLLLCVCILNKPIPSSVRVVVLYSMCSHYNFQRSWQIVPHTSESHREGWLARPGGSSSGSVTNTHTCMYIVHDIVHVVYKLNVVLL